MKRETEKADECAVVELSMEESMVCKDAVILFKVANNKRVIKNECYNRSNRLS